ncbi:coadhesin-like [Saccostrea echinata]|uniref:coadhesin-like n=1 Tax=Saccostrea echinata TaxID=191078 RepID=UPI002A82B611|nr:coadhesin-like [Saccostrea echinata]
MKLIINMNWIIVNGGWSSYGPWSKFKECTVTCGGGDKTRYRYRECNNPKPQHGGRSCSGNSVLSHTTPCNTSPCAVSSVGNETVHPTNETENDSFASQENEFDSSGSGNETVISNTNQTSGDSQPNQVTIGSTITETPDDRESTTPMAEWSTKNENQSEE